MCLLNKFCLILLIGVYCEAQAPPMRKEAYMTVMCIRIQSICQAFFQLFVGVGLLGFQSNRMLLDTSTYFTSCVLLIIFPLSSKPEHLYGNRSQAGQEDTYWRPSLIRAAGYPTEKHRVTTPDGYVLQMHRIPAGRRSARRTGDLKAKGKKAILIVHGLLGSSSDFVIMGPERSVAYLLADAGYDVWLANLRGNVYTTHKNLTRNDEKFWDYSFHEHGKYDVPAMIDRVLNVTGLDKIMYMGYSMGTTSFFTMMSLRPEYNEKGIAFIALAPAVYLDNVKPVANLALNTLDIPAVLKARGMLALQPQLLQSLIANLCNLQQPQADLCTSFIFAIIGEDYEQNDLEMAPIYLHRIQPGSWRTLEHFGKIAMTGVFTTYSRGLSGPVKPYNISNVKIPVSLLYGENDQLTEKFQILRLAEDLKANGVLEEVRPGCSWPKFNHIDFVFAKDVGTLFNKPLIKHIDQMYNKYSTI